jgi:exodeoxyribonuclease-3
MKIISWNVNGLRSVVRKGFLEWVKKENPDILCLQEIKIEESEIPFDLLYLNSYNSFINSSRKKGHSGVAVYSKEKPLKINRILGLKRFDEEGRMLKITYPGLTLINVYIPHGGRDKHDYGYKLEVYRKLIDKMKDLKTGNVILVGDFNVAHEEIDLARPEGNKNNIMFTPAERFQIDRLMHLGFVDSFRVFNKEAGNYSWLTYYKDAREKGLGWRLDYAFVSESLAPKLKEAFILKEITLGSDHCPIGVEIGIDTN